MSDAASTLRQYVESHPWISFELNLQSLDYRTWMRVGEALSKCDHIAGVPLQPQVAHQLHMLYMVKGIHATTQIEGNTLSEEEVRLRIEGGLDLPESQEYLGQEIDNVLAACNEIAGALNSGSPRRLTPERIAEFNGLVLRNLELKPGVTPGVVRSESVLVGTVYRGAPAQDCDYLLEQLCQWIDDLRADCPPELRRPVAVISAIMAHLYLAWIHPFDDGNGRTARLIEFQLMVEAGFPTPAAHLLSNYYNRTRTRYYEVLRETSQHPYPVHNFISYAMKGLCEELRSQLDFIREQQMNVAFINHVHRVFHDLHGFTATRQRELLLALPVDQRVPLARLRHLTPELAELYSGKTHRTVVRDANRLMALGLLEVQDGHARARIEEVAAFLPLRLAAPDERD